MAIGLMAVVVLAGCAAPSPSDAGHQAAVDVDEPAVTDGATDVPAPSVSAPATDCVSGGSRVRVTQAGSSTVLPIAETWAEEFSRCIGASMVVGGGGTGSGFKRFCRGEIDISDASRPIKDSERTDCKNNKIDPFELQIGIDGLAVVVNAQNSFVDHLTVTELNKIWTADKNKQAVKWKDLRSDWPDEKIALYGPGTDSGTFDYFVEVIITPFDGAASKGRSDFTPSEDDNVLVQGIASNQYALGYFGLAYAVENPDKVKAVPIDDGKADNGDGPMAPTPENVESGKYAPLSRPLFMYTNGKPSTAVLQAYFAKGLSTEGQDFVAEVGYIKLPEPLRLEMLQRLQ
jgi:phosphate transport system substrate-binding protein